MRAGTSVKTLKSTKRERSALQTIQRENPEEVKNLNTWLVHVEFEKKTGRSKTIRGLNDISYSSYITRKTSHPVAPSADDFELAPRREKEDVRLPYLNFCYRLVGPCMR